MAFKYIFLFKSSIFFENGFAKLEHITDGLFFFSCVSHSLLKLRGFFTFSRVVSVSVTNNLFCQEIALGIRVKSTINGS